MPAPPRTARGTATRQSLLDAALRLFAEKGFHNTTVPDIVREAGVGHGTFYEYFGNRRDVLSELTRQLVERSEARPQVEATTLAERVRQEVHWYLSDYVDNLDLFKIWAAAMVDEADIDPLRRELQAPMLARIARGIERAGRPGIDPNIGACALLSMLEQFAYRWFIVGDGPGTKPKHVFEAAQTLATLWTGAIGADGDMT